MELHEFNKQAYPKKIEAIFDIYFNSKLKNIEEQDLKNLKEKLKTCRLNNIQFIEETLQRYHFQNPIEFILLQINLIENSIKDLKTELKNKSYDESALKIVSIFSSHYKRNIKEIKARYFSLLTLNRELECSLDVRRKANVNVDILFMELKNNRFIPKSAKLISLKKLFNGEPVKRFVWIGSNYELCYFISSLSLNNVFVDTKKKKKKHWEAVKNIFVNQNNEKFKIFETPRGKNKPAKLKTIDSIINSCLI